MPYPLGTAEDLLLTREMAVAAGGRAISAVADVRDRAAITKTINAGTDEFGGLHALVVNHGVQSFSLLEDMDYDTWDEVVRVNLTGVFNVIREGIPHLIEAGWGRVIVTPP